MTILCNKINLVSHYIQAQDVWFEGWRVFSNTLNSAYNEKKYAEIFLRYSQLFVKGDVIIGEFEILGVEVFLCYSQFFVKGNYVIDRLECISSWISLVVFFQSGNQKNGWLMVYPTVLPSTSIKQHMWLKDTLSPLGESV